MEFMNALLGHESKRGSKSHIPKRLFGRRPSDDELTALASLVVKVIIRDASPFARDQIVLIVD
ncbi:hypothetical protein N7471_012690 [Penicillium samsonianum]|uniref:uncharacterized protein n=1 Tax=Penicillium samsonianum TaxID=1882272 RepID=UPI002549B646|nr:uncharacterized protein N7471_012690 [Penicillium samsonianum]KAJ6125373.1 hypothetical protein N7471_012690 [Penicillium samsonianum]